MPQYVLPIENYRAWEILDAFTQGYIEALFFTETEPSTTRDDHDPALVEAGQISEMPGDYGFTDLSQEALAGIIADCKAFQERAGDLLDLADDRGYDSTQAGRDFWFTRNGHGVGFWDRKELEHDSEEWRATQIPFDQWTPEMRKRREEMKAESLGERLSDIAREIGEVWAYVGDDGRVYIQ